MRLEELREEVEDLVNFNSAQSDQSFAGPSTDPYKWIDKAINQAYREEIKRARREMSHNAFLKTHSMTWAADASTMSIPKGIKSHDILAIRDDTGTAPGLVLVFSDNTSAIDGIYIYDHETLGWYPAPSSARTLVVYYLASPNELKNASDTPDLLKPDDHDLLIYSAAIILSMKGDEKAPNDWKEKQFDLRWQFHKAVARGLYNVAINPPSKIAHDDYTV
jgi:hypothetical protein